MASWFDAQGFYPGDRIDNTGVVGPNQGPQSTPVTAQNVVYTDTSGRGYSPETLSQAWSSGALSGDPINARVPDILAQYGMGGQPAAAPQAAPSFGMGGMGGSMGGFSAPSLSLSQMAAPEKYTLPTQAEVEATPGYQFTRDQGMRGVQSSAIARGAGIGGAALKELGQYTTGLADQFYGNRVSQGMAANNMNFGQGLQTNQFNSNNALSQFGANLQGQRFGLDAQNQSWNQGFNENRNAFDQYDRSQQSAFDQWLKLAELGNPGNPYT